MASRKAPPPMDRSMIKPPLAGSLGLTPEYLEAVKLLSVETMNQACSMVLSNAPDASEKLQSLYEKCSKAVAIVNRDAPMDVPKLSTLAVKRDSHTSSMMQVNRGLPYQGSMMMRGGQGMMGSTANAKNLVAAKGRIMTRPATAPMRGKISRIDLSQQQQQQQQQPKHDSDSSSNDKHIMKQRGGVHKMQRTASGVARPLSPTSNKAGAAASAQTVMAPPPSALNFLAKLNKDKGATAATKEIEEESSRSKPRRPSPKNNYKKEREESIDEVEKDEEDEEEDEDDDDMEVDKDEGEHAGLPKEEPTRRQPTRSSRRK
ncbi:hypothetical protein MPSEU_001024300 [Mayamaea pseudoterrestris]|nr:hypothetical protein MPSEU_001024300 [Mayamaea pseudoterrestris]